MAAVKKINVHIHVTKDGAKEDYSALYREVQSLLGQFERKLAKHEKDFAAGGAKNYGYVGDLERYRSVLKSII